MSTLKKSEDLHDIDTVLWSAGSEQHGIWVAIRRAVARTEARIIPTINQTIYKALG